MDKVGHHALESPGLFSRGFYALVECNGMNAVHAPFHSRFLGVGDVARLAGVCTKTIRRWDENGRLKPSHRTAGNHRRYSLQVVLVFLRGEGMNAGKEPDPAVQLGAAIYSRVSSSRQRTKTPTSVGAREKRRGKRSLRQLWCSCSRKLIT